MKVTITLDAKGIALLNTLSAQRPTQSTEQIVTQAAIFGLGRLVYRHDRNHSIKQVGQERDDLKQQLEAVTKLLNELKQSSK